MSQSVKLTKTPSNEVTITDTTLFADVLNETDLNSNQQLSALATLSENTNQESIKQKLTTQYLNWRGTPYRMGGLSKKGVDCSGFVFLTFLEQFNINLPRSTSTQIKAGVKVARNELQVGDLVFFKNKNNQRHVCIYFGESNFIHASTQKGVKISSLLNTYWSSTYWFASRL